MSTESDEEDKPGLDTLEAIAKANRFNSWMFETFEPYCAGRILEIGSGIGNISDYFIRKGKDIVLTDMRANYCQFLEANYGHKPGVAVYNMDIAKADFGKRYQSHVGKYDCVFALNVIEHIEDDQLALQNCYQLLKPNGQFIMLVPAYAWLFNGFDRSLQHYRRYNKTNSAELFNKAGFQVIRQQYFNLAGIPGWYLSGKVQGNAVPPPNQVSFFNMLVPAFKILDQVTLHSAGLSIITVGKK